jgi:hypothetical protein
VGGPYFNEYKNSDFSEEWNKENKSMQFCHQKTLVNG